MPHLRGRNFTRRRIGIVFHSAAGGTRLVARLLRDLLAGDHDVSVTSIAAPGASEAASSADLLVLCYPTYFLKPSTSMAEFLSRMPTTDRPKAAYLVTTYELYTENSLRACALLLKEKGFVVSGTAAIRAPGSDLTCVLPAWLCPWLYRFGRGVPGKLRSIAGQVGALATRGGPERIPRPKWYTWIAQPLQRWLFDDFIHWRTRMRILPDRCSDCDACVARCHRGAWVREDRGLVHQTARCELCTACIHHCPRDAIVLAPLLKDNPRLDARRYAELERGARADLFPVPVDGEE